MDALTLDTDKRNHLYLREFTNEEFIVKGKPFGDRRLRTNSFIIDTNLCELD